MPFKKQASQNSAQKWPATQYSCLKYFKILAAEAVEKIDQLGDFDQLYDDMNLPVHKGYFIR